MKHPLTILLLCGGAILAQATEVRAQTTAQTTAPQPGDANFPKPSPSARHDQKVSDIRSGEYDLVMIGDSITHTLQDFGGKYAPLKTRVWEKYYAPHRAINLGYSGYRTENILWNQRNGELDFKKSPKLFVLLIGTNNANKTHYPRMHTPQEIQAGTKAIVNEIRGAHPSSKILLIRPLPKGQLAQRGEATSQPVFTASQEEVETTRQAGDLIAKLADDQTVFSLDVGAVFLRPDGTVKPDLLWDLLHPGPEGAEAMARVVEPVIAKLMGEKSVLATAIPETSPR